MIEQERDRLPIAFGVSVIAHIVIALLAILFAGPPRLPEYLPPLTVELGVPETPEPEVVPPPEEPRPAPEPEPEPEPLTQSEAVAEARPEVPETAPAAGAPEPSAPAPGGRAEGAVGNDPLTGPPPAEITEADIFDRPEPTAPRGRRSRTLGEPQAGDLATDVDLPEWAGNVFSEAGVSPGQMSAGDATDVARRMEDNPEFRRLLTEAVSGLDRRAAESATSGEPASDSAGADTGTEPGATPGATPGSDSTGTADGSQGDPRLSWEGGDRGSAGELPELTAADFDGRVPAETRFVVIFEVNERGLVDPGSIIFQQRSRYTQANEKVRGAIASWGFRPAPGAGTQSAVFTLVVRREDLR